jgi:hypothetical protein
LVFAMTTTALSARTIGAARPESAVIVSISAMCVGATTATAVPAAMSWYGPDGFGFPVNHKRHTRRPPSPTP